ncbi:MAG: hypothetical protein JJE28_04030 [Actinomycetales bacterium]|nr:hypothetical protein [Actinomycetales bacterium]
MATDTPTEVTKWGISMMIHAVQVTKWGISIKGGAVAFDKPAISNWRQAKSKEQRAK